MFMGGRKIENSRFAHRFGQTPSLIGNWIFQNTPNARNHRAENPAEIGAQFWG
jgi:hypothetical protein